MWTNKYKIARNHKLLPQIDPKPTNPKIKTFALLNTLDRAQYQLHLHPSDPHTFVMFNQNQYLQRQCTSIIAESDPSKAINKIAEIFPGEGPKLTIFMSNNPWTSDQLILGPEGKQSLLSLAYKQLRSKKDMKSQIFISIVGIESENSLTDELQFQWLQQSQRLIKYQGGLGRVLRSKSRLNLMREPQNCGYLAQNISRHRIQSPEALGSILTRYSDVKECISNWIQLERNTDFEQLGLLYILCEAEYNPETTTVTKILKNHYILQINRYMRATAPLLLRLSMSLKKINDLNLKLLDSQDNKLFKLLSECFKHQAYTFHLFLQVGEYSTFKDQHMSLASLSEFMLPKHTLDRYKIQQQGYIYHRHYIDHPLIMKIITDIEASLPSQQKDKMETIIAAHRHEADSVAMRIKSYHCDTVSSEQKKMLRKQRLLTEEDKKYPKLALEELVHQTSEIYRFPSYQKESSRERQLSSHFSKGRISNLRSQTRKNPLSLKESFESKKSRKVKVKSKCLTPLLVENCSPRHENASKQSKKYYEQVRAWLDKAYGKTRNQKIKQFYKSIQKGKGISSQFLTYPVEQALEKDKIDKRYIKEQLQQREQEYIEGKPRQQNQQREVDYKQVENQAIDSKSLRLNLKNQTELSQQKQCLASQAQPRNKPLEDQSQYLQERPQLVHNNI